MTNRLLQDKERLKGISSLNTPLTTSEFISYFSRSPEGLVVIEHEELKQLIYRLESNLSASKCLINKA